MFNDAAIRAGDVSSVMAPVKYAKEFIMPIANCVITQECSEGEGDLIDLWAKESLVSPEHMTINIIISSEQRGRRYKVMANLVLPSVWSASDISMLQLGLARALSKYFAVAVSEVIVISTIVASGMVVESGKEVRW